MIIPNDKIKIDAECIEMDSLISFCKPFKGDLPFDGNFYYYEFSPKCVFIISATDIMLGNKVIGAGLDGKITNEMIKEFKLFYRKAKRPGFTVQTSPLVLNEKVISLLKENNGVHKSSLAKFVKPAEEVITVPVQNSNDVVIRPAEQKDKEGLSRILLKSFGFPLELITLCKSLLDSDKWISFAGLLNGKISGSGSVFIKGENAELGGAATDESARGKGIQTALIKARELYAIKNNCKFLFVETAEPTPDYRAPTYRNMVKSGYTEIYRRPNYFFKI